MKLDKHDVSPFAVDYDSFDKVIKTVGGEYKEMIDGDSGEVLGVMRERKKVTFISDHSTFIKIYPKAFKSRLGDMGICSLQLLFYIMMELKVNGDTVYLDADDFLCSMVYSKKSIRLFYSAVNTLVDIGVIAKKDGKVYWVNHNMIYNGNRKKLIQDESLVKERQVKEWYR